MTRFLLVPGRGLPLPNHWLRQWARAHRDWAWAPEPPGPPYLPDERVADLQAAIAASKEPAILIAHSAGCLSLALWEQRHTGPVTAALLVTPPVGDHPAVHLPRRRLPFRSILVASRNDPHAAFRQSRQCAADWGAELFDAGAVGHLDTASGFGPWPDGERLVARLAAAR